MVKTRNPLSSEEASGSVGRTTYKRWGQVQVAGRKSRGPGNPRTSAQVDARNIIAAVSQAWAGLVPNQRAEWEAYAAQIAGQNNLGDVVRLPAFDVYMSANMVQYRGSGATFAAPSPTWHGTDFATLSFTDYGGGPWWAVWTVVPGLPSPSYVELWLQGPLANKLRGLRQPEQRFNRTSITTIGTREFLNMTSGLYYYVGARLCVGGCVPRPIQWYGPVIQT